MSHNKDMKQLYIKYKNKYLNLKKNLKETNLKGGLGYYKQFWKAHPDFNKHNIINEQSLILNREYNAPQDYNLELDNLLRVSNHSINMDFINNFYRKIYYDTENKYALNFTSSRETALSATAAPVAAAAAVKPTKVAAAGLDSDGKEDPVYKDVLEYKEGDNIQSSMATPAVATPQKAFMWVNNNTDYNIQEVLPDQEHGNTTIIILKHKSSELKLVLKIFNKIDINIEKIKDYLSLEITKIVPDDSPEKSSWFTSENFNILNKTKFEEFNFNNQRIFIKTQDNLDLLLSVSNNDAINDYIINIIMHKIIADSQAVSQVNEKDMPKGLVNISNISTVMDLLDPTSTAAAAIPSDDTYIATAATAAAAGPTNSPTARLPNSPTARLPSSPTARPSSSPAARPSSSPTARLPSSPAAAAGLPSSPAAEQGDQGIVVDTIKYYNLCVLNINGTYRYCIIMDHYDGSLSKKYNDVVRFTDSEEQIANFITTVFNNIKSYINKFKSEKYLFTHTDFKLENLLYKEKDDKLTIVLTDFDKSSISYHSVRFYNDKVVSIVNRKIGLSFGISDYLLIDQYTIDSAPLRKDAEDTAQNIFPYKLSRALRRNTSIIQTGIKIIGNYTYEPEEYYMRYNITPYYVSFDMVSLFLSFIYKYKSTQTRPQHILENIKNILYSVFTEYMDDGPYNALIVRYDTLVDNYNGNFGHLINPLLEISDPTRNIYLFKHTINREQYIFINKLYLTNRNKIATSIAFKPNLLSALVGRSDDMRLNIFVDGTKKLYESLGIHVNNDVYKNNISIEYSTDFALFPSIWQRILPKIIVKTNRYSIIMNLYKLIYDFDVIEEGTGKEETPEEKIVSIRKYGSKIIILFDIMQQRNNV